MIKRYFSPEHRQNISIGVSLSLLGKTNELGRRWKGEDASYQAKHIWLYKNFGKATRCENKACVYPRKNLFGQILTIPTRFEWANISGKYIRDINDWKQLCASCHRKYDNIGKKSWITRRAKSGN